MSVEGSLGFIPGPRSTSQLQVDWLFRTYTGFYLRFEQNQGILILHGWHGIEWYPSRRYECVRQSLKSVQRTTRHSKESTEFLWQNFEVEESIFGEFTRSICLGVGLKMPTVWISLLDTCIIFLAFRDSKSGTLTCTALIVIQNSNCSDVLDDLKRCVQESA